MVLVRSIGCTVCHCVFLTKLSNLLANDLQVDKNMSNKKTNKLDIGKEISLSCYLRWLGGGSYLHIRLTAGISVTSFYKCIHKCIFSINNCKELSYYFPSTNDKLTIAANGFKTLSTKVVLLLLMDFFGKLKYHRRQK
jgi:hypothetical protein